MENFKDYIPIKGYEELYLISKNGMVWSIKHKKHITIYTKNKTYPDINLTKNSISKRFKIHRLVALNFLENIENKPCVHHINSNKSDYRLENLCWVTYSENMQFSIKDGIHKTGDENSKTTISDKDVLEIYFSSGSYSKIAKHFNTIKRTVYSIKNLKCRQHLLKHVSNATIFQNKGVLYINDRKIEFNILLKQDLQNNTKDKIIDIILPYDKKQIKDFPNYNIDINGNVMNIKKQTYLKKQTNNTGYNMVRIGSKLKLVHRLVAETFIENPENKTFVNHKNFKRDDNNINNLEWCSPSENAQHYINNKYISNSKLQENEVIEIFNSKESNIKL